MSKKITDEDIQLLARKYKRYQLNHAALCAIVEVESSYLGGFGGGNGRLTIQFEPHHFRKISKKNKGVNPPNTGIWDKNLVDTQSREWRAFNDAWRIDPNAAMQATSIGLMQVMGFNYPRCGFKEVGRMWDYAKESERNQLELGLLYIIADPKLVKAIQDEDWNTFAYFYNGPLYRNGGYHTKLASAYARAKKRLINKYGADYDRA